MFTQEIIEGGPDLRQQGETLSYVLCVFVRFHGVLCGVPLWRAYMASISLATLEYHSSALGGQYISAPS